MAKNNIAAEIVSLKNLKEVHKILSNMCLYYIVKPNAFEDNITMIDLFSINSSIDRFAILKDESINIFDGLRIPAMEMRTFLANYTKTNTEFTLHENGIAYYDTKKDIGIKLDRDEFDKHANYSILYKYAKLDEEVFNIVFDSDKMIKLDGNTLEMLSNNEMVSNDGVIISKAIIDPKRTLSIRYRDLNYINSDEFNNLRYRLYMLEYDSIDIFTSIQYVKCY